MTAAAYNNECFAFGPLLRENGTTFRLWAPAARTVSIEIDGAPTAPMSHDGEGLFSLETPARPGARYFFVIDGTLRVPDPASREQANDAPDESVVPDPHPHDWRCQDWRGRPWEESVLFELHVGLLGGFRGVAQHLGRLATLGVTAIELMPLADFPGRRNWGYDGVLPFAPDRTYGTPVELRALVDSAHALGVMVFLDVVYNHFGPEGNWLGTYAPQFFRHDARTPWGGAIDFRQPPVRRFFIENALYWIHEFHVDGLRLDAVHAIFDRDWLQELAAEIRKGVPRDRHFHLVVENDNNDAGLLREGFDAQWNDDFHHAVHVLLTGEREGYYADYAAAPAQSLARVLAEGFAYQGEASAHRGGRTRGSDSADLPPSAFVAFLQNHDQIGNRAFGERLTTLAAPEALRAAVALQLLCPQIPLIFMGEEVGAREPFLYFTDFREELAQAVRKGRQAEFARFATFADVETRARIPDPNAPSTFERSRPDFDRKDGSDWNRLYTDLLTIRRAQIVPHLRGTRSIEARVIANSAVIASWRLGNDSRLIIAANFGNAEVRGSFPLATPVWGTPPEDVLQPRTTVVWIEP